MNGFSRIDGLVIMALLRAAPWRVVISVILTLLPLAVFAAGAEVGDDAVLAAHRAFLARDRAGLARAAEKTGNHVLDVYVRYWLLRLGIAEADPETIDDCLNRNAGTVVAERLRQDWLHELGRQGKWELFSRHFPLLLTADSENKCYALQERLLRLGLDDQIAADVKAFWNVPRPLPGGCLPVALAMIRTGRFTSREIRERLQLLFMENLVAEARRTRELYPHDDLPAAKQWEDVFGSPVAFLKQDEAVLKRAKNTELSFVALLSLSRHDLPRAANLLAGKMKNVLAPQEQQRLWAFFAIRGARLHLPEAGEWFRRGGNEALSGEHLAWRVRVALRQGNWPEAKSAIEGMSASLRNESAWTYWLGRSLCMTGNSEEGRKLFRAIAGQRDFYGLLAAEELGISLQMPGDAVGPAQQELAQVSGLPGIKRALALYRLNLRTDASQEWRWCVRTMDDRQLLAAAELARMEGLWDRSVNTAEMTSAEHNFSLRYPAPHKEVLLRHARNCQLDEAVVLGLVRQESLFVADARSSAGATGLMQLMPETARMVARDIGLNGFKNTRLTQPEVNAALGTSYLRQILNKFSANYAFAAAAYNAGPNRAQRWRNDRPLEGAIYVESIPFTETRSYVKKVLANAVYYAAVSGGRVLSLKQMLGTIAGSAAVVNSLTESLPPWEPPYDD
jgi:soluble lytic murein transglycosylase